MTNSKLTPQLIQDIYTAAVAAECASNAGAEMADFDLLCKTDDVGGIAHVMRKLIDMVRANDGELQQYRKTSQALHDVTAERQRQQSVKGYSIQQDDTYIAGELAAAAISYIEPMEAVNYWPSDWHDDSFKPSDYRRNLVKAAALLLAEVERIDRQEQSVCN